MRELWTVKTRDGSKARFLSEDGEHFRIDDILRFCIHEKGMKVEDIVSCVMVEHE